MIAITQMLTQLTLHQNSNTQGIMLNDIGNLVLQVPFLEYTTVRKTHPLVTH